MDHITSSVALSGMGGKKGVKAVYINGLLQLEEPLALPAGTELHVRILPVEYAESLQGILSEAGPKVSEATSEKLPHPQSAAIEAARQFSAGVPVHVSGPFRFDLAWLLFGLGMVVYAVTRFWRILDFPIYFFTDEAANPLFAEALIANGLRDAQGTFFPIYFEVAGNRWGPLFSVYIHALSMTLFGKSALVTRATQAFVSFLAPIATSLILKDVFQKRYWWTGALLLAIAPAWFLHSRTGFETVMMASFFACFLLFYFLYRTRSPRYLFVALLFGALSFYTYSSGQMLMVATGAALAISDCRYHLRHWRVTLPGLLLVALLALPVIRFRAMNPDFMETTLRTMNSYLFHDLSLTQKIEIFLRTWMRGLSPQYWFIPNDTLLIRHRMEGYGNLSAWLLPFFVIGVGWSLWRVKDPLIRAILLVAFVSPMGAALVEDVGITRVLAFTIPASIIIAFGIEAFLTFIGRFSRLPSVPVAMAIFGLFSVASVGMLRDALVNGPLWFRDYGLYGMQYGARQLFGQAIPAYLDAHPAHKVLVSPTWANGADNFVRFFLTKEQQARVQMLNVDYFMIARRPLDSSMLFVMTPEEFARAESSGKFKSIEIVQTIQYPDGRDGFYFAYLAYADNLEEIIAQEREARSKPVLEQIQLDDQLVEVLHSQFDMGQLPNIFDGDKFTLVRGLEANPLVLDFRFPHARQVSGLKATFASMDFTLTVSLYPPETSAPVVYEQTYRGLPPDPSVELFFDRGPSQVVRAHIAILQLNAPQDVHIHVREIKFQ